MLVGREFQAAGLETAKVHQSSVIGSIIIYQLTQADPKMFVSVCIVTAIVAW